MFNPWRYASVFTVVFIHLLLTVYAHGIWCAAVGVHISRALIGALVLTSLALFDNTEAAGRACVFIQIARLQQRTRRGIHLF